MEKNNKILVVLVVILGLLVILFGGYIIYDKVFSKEIKEDENINKDDNKDNLDIENDLFDSNIENEESLLTEDEIKIILKELDEKFYSFHTALGPYCGEFDRDDYISFGSYETYDFRDYWASKTFMSVNELDEYLKSIMVLDLVPKYIDDGESYIEKDGKLYCQLAHKGGGITRDYEIEPEYTIQKNSNLEIIADVLFCGQEMGEMECSDKKISITIVKDINGNWLVSNYKLLYS